MKAAEQQYLSYDPTWRTVPLGRCNHPRQSHLHRSRFAPTATRQTSLNATVCMSSIQDKGDYHHCLSESFLDHQAACNPPAKDASLLCPFPSQYDLVPSNAKAERTRPAS